MLTKEEVTEIVLHCQSERITYTKRLNRVETQMLGHASEDIFLQEGEQELVWHEKTGRTWFFANKFPPMPPRKLLLAITLLVAFLIAFNHYFKLYAFNPYSVCMTKSLRVMTWNIHISDPGFKQKQKAVAAEILKQDADVVLINEFYLKTSVELDSIVRGAYPFVSEVGANYGCGDILYSRYPIQNSERVERYGFPTLIYEFKLLLNNQTIRLIGCHLISTNNFSKGHRYTVQKVGDITSLPDYYAVYKKGKERRTQEAELIREYLLAEDLPTIVFGDMNDFSGTSPLNTLESTGLKDAWWQRGTGFGVTFCEGWMRFRIDHILYDSHWNPISIRVVQSDLSDHLPLVGEFSMK